MQNKARQPSWKRFVALLSVIFIPLVTNGKPQDMSATVLVAAGDIATCSGQGDEATAQLLAEPSLANATIATLGDHAYPSGSQNNFMQCYDPSWGRFKARTRPAAGNHEYLTDAAEPYFTYFGSRVGDPRTGYYSYTLGAWHIIVLNSNCANIGGCESGSPQEQWLRADLLQSSGLCTLAYWHHPRFSSGPHGNTQIVQPLWQALFDAHAEVILNGHDHAYERFAPQAPDGQALPFDGIQEFVVGTGGANLYQIEQPIANSEAHTDDTFGVLKLTLYQDRYDWQFLPTEGNTFVDQGSRLCH